jgi:hypothetical protein
MSIEREELNTAQSIAGKVKSARLSRRCEELGALLTAQRGQVMLP